jgi:nitrogen regulatory protein P-II 1
MKKVEVELAAHHVDGVKERLRLIGIPAMTLTVCAALRGRAAAPRGPSTAAVVMDWARLEIVVADDLVDSVVRAVMTVVGRADGAEGRIAIAPIEAAIRISTGDSGGDAL